MRNPDREKEQGEAHRIGMMGGAGALGGALDRFIRGHGPKAAGGSALRGGVESAAAQGLGDLLMGEPKEHGFMDEMKRGAAGGAVVGGLSGMVNGGMAKGGAGLVHFLMQQGLGKKAAIALAFGAAGANGAASGALGHGVSAGLLNYEPEEK